MFFYDDVLSLYINDSPLLISSKVVTAARSVNVDLRWDNKGQVCGVSYDVSMNLSQRLGIQVLSVREFMALATREPRVTSSEFAEWMTDRFTVAENSQIFDSNGERVHLPISRTSTVRACQVGSPLSMLQASGNFGVLRRRISHLELCAAL